MESVNAKIYGIPAMSLEEEVNLAPNVRQTEQNKMHMIDWCDWIRSGINQIESRARAIPLEDDGDHAEMVAEMTRLVREAEKAVWKAATYGIS